MSSLQILEDFDHDKEVVVLSLTGDIDANTYTALKQRLEDLFLAARYRIVIDLSDLDYVSSPGLELFIRIAQEVHLHNGKFVLMSPSEQIRTVLNFVGVTQIADVTTGIRSALNLF